MAWEGREITVCDKCPKILLDPDRIQKAIDRHNKKYPPRKRRLVPPKTLLKQFVGALVRLWRVHI